MIERKTSIQDIKLVDFPEEIDMSNGIKLYGQTSWENQLAVLSHFLHNTNFKDDDSTKYEAICAIREFLEQKKDHIKGTEELTGKPKPECPLRPRFI